MPERCPSLPGAAGLSSCAKPGAPSGERVLDLAPARRYRREAARRLAALALLLAVFLALFLAALATGSSPCTWPELWDALIGGPGRTQDIVRELRVPRAVMAALIGWGLAQGGCVTQAVLRNPLASPFTLGVASAAAFGAVLAITLLNTSSNMVLAACAFASALGVSLLILVVARARRLSTPFLILAGVAFMYLFSALTAFLQYIGNMETIQRVVFWTFGNLSKAGWPEITLAACMILPCSPVLLRWSWDLNLLLSGDEAARSLGVNVDRVRLGSIFLASLMTAGAICFTGVVGFIGLVAPHISRMLIGSDHRFLLPASGLAGAALLVGADTLGRAVWAPQVIPVGIMTSFIGVPFFFFLLLRRGGRRS